jgi:transposase-like protein
MPPVSYTRHQFPAVLIQHAVWLYLRFTLSYRDVEDLLAERGVEISYETVRRWVQKFGPVFAKRLQHSHSKPSRQWHLDEMVARIAGETVISGAPLITKARSSMCSCSADETRTRPQG